MPPKRKTATSFTDDSSPKRCTRSNGLHTLTPKKPLKTYGRNPCHVSLTNTQKDYEESSEDELILSPSRFKKTQDTPSSRKSLSSVVEVTTITTRRAVADRSSHPTTNLYRSPRKSRAPDVSSSSGVAMRRSNGGYVNDSPGSPSSTKIPQTLPTKAFTPSINPRKRRQDPTDGELPPPPKKLKPATTPRTSESPSVARQAFPARTAHMISTPASPLNDVITSVASSPPRTRLTSRQTHLPQEILPHLYPCLNAQKRAILRALHHPPPKALYCDEEEDEEDEIATNQIAFQHLTDVLTGTVTRGEGNSCILLGPRGSGKTSVRVSAL